MRSYFACSLAIALLAAAGCGDNKPGTDARDAAGDGTGDGIGLGDRADLGGSDRADVGVDTGGTDTPADTGADTGTGGTGGTGGTDGGTDSGADAGDGGGSDGATPTCQDGIKNSDETGVDCGGHCGKCGPGNDCMVNAVCTYACKADKKCAACNLAADCSGPENECEHRSCTAGVCGSTREAAGTVLTVQTTGDCKRRQCAADGTVAVANDDTDVPDDRNPCTNDVCTSGTASHTMMPNGANCGGANTCNATGQCVGCAVATDCPGTDTNCRTRTCTGNGVCGFQYAASGMPLVDPTAGDCKGLQCDGNGNSQVVNVNTDLPVDGNACTTDECSSGTPSHRPVNSGTNCGGSLVCDGASHCVECLTATTCPGTDADCHTRSCVAGECGVSNTAAGSLIAAQTPRDCKKSVCDGQGGTQTANDDLDLPFDNNPCTQDVCTAGTPSNPFTTAGNSCGTNTICDGQGACVTCISPSTCPGTDTDCHHRTCINGACGIANTSAGTATSAQATGDCKAVQCDGNGSTMMVNDDNDLPVDGNTCTGDVCTAGVPTNPAVSTGTVCGTNLMCNGSGSCVGCVTAANCGTDTFCQMHTCTNGTCGVTNTTAGMALPAGSQMTGDCKSVQCDGQGQQQTVNDDSDTPSDGNQCTQDVCSGGIPSNPPAAANATCNMNSGNRCNGTGTCVQCLLATDCAGTDTECHHRTCSNAGVCGIANEADGKLMNGQTTGDCKKNVCMNGAPAVANDDLDVLVDGNGCTSDVCTNGTPSNPSLGAGAACNENGGTRCNGSATVPACVQCLNNGQCGTDTLCQMFHCDSAGQCGSTFVTAGATVGPQMTGDCQKNVCNGTGTIVPAIDNADVPVDGNQCTADVCTGGNPSNPPLAGGVACNMNNGTMCNGSASAPACVQCLNPTDCGTNTFCKTFTCSSSGMCGSTNTQDGTLDTSNPDAAGNCHKNVCTNGATASAVDDTDLPVDGNPCTDDVCSNGTQSNPPKQLGTTCGLNQMCNATGSCVGCNTDTDCPMAPNVCQVRVCMTGNVCGFTNVAAGTPVPDASGNCKKDQCDGYGNIATVNDDTDVLVDNNPCTQDLCNAGTPSNPLVNAGTACSLGGNPLANQCDNNGNCVECQTATTCPGGPDTDCHARTCVSGACGIVDQPEFTATTMQSAMPDCHKVVCDGAGGTRNDIDDTDVPFNPNACQTVTCMVGNVMTTNSQVGTACSQNGGNRCDASPACVPTFMVVRLGDGSVPLTSAATAVFVEERWETDGTTYRTLALPTTGTSPKPFTLSGTADAAGGLALSSDGHFVTLAGFTSAIPTLMVASTNAATAPRSVAMINAAGTVDTSTTLGTTAFNQDNPRSAITSNGMQFWVAGNGNSTNRGVYYSGMLGGTTTTQIESASNATRTCQIAFGQLYCDATTSNFGIFTVGSGLPTATQTPPGFSTLNATGAEAGASFYAFFFLNSTTLYIADDRVAPTGGIQKWTLGGMPATWTKQGTFTTGAAGSPGIRGLAMHDSAAGVVLIGSTASASPAPNAIVKFVDSGSFAVAPATLQAATGNFVYRGVAMAPQ